MKYIIIICLGLLPIISKAQTEPSGFPVQSNTGWQQWGFQQSTKGLIVATRDTMWVPKYCGTMILWPHAGVDTAYWMWDCVRWKKLSSAGDVVAPIWGNITGTLSNQTDLQNALNLKFNISDTANLWWGIGKSWVDTMYRVNDSTIGYTINGAAYTFQILGSSGGGASGFHANNGLFASGDTAQLGQIVGAIGDPAKFNSDRELPLNTHRFIISNGEFRADSVRYAIVNNGSLFGVTSLVSGGNSITLGVGASDPDSDYVSRLANYYGISFTNLGVSGITANQACAISLANVNPGHSSMNTMCIGVNNLRINGGGQATKRAIKNAYEATMVNALLASYTPASSCTLFGSWTTGINAVTSAGGKTTAAATTSTNEDSLTVDISGTGVGFGIIGQANTGASAVVYIDGIKVDSFSTAQQTVDSGTGFQSMGKYYTHLSNTTHHVKVVKRGGSGTLFVDYVGVLLPPASMLPFVIIDVPHLDSIGYASYGARPSEEDFDIVNDTLSSVYMRALNAGLKVYHAKVNDFYRVKIGISNDHVHPNDIGYRQIFNSIVFALNAITGQSGTLLFAKDNRFYGVDTFGVGHQFAYMDDIKAKPIELNGIINNFNDSTAGSLIVGENVSVYGHFLRSTTLDSGLIVIGDLRQSATKWNLINSRGTPGTMFRAGIGMYNDGIHNWTDVYGFGSGGDGVQLGQVSLTDGATFVPYFQVSNVESRALGNFVVNGTSLLTGAVTVNAGASIAGDNVFREINLYSPGLGIKHGMRMSGSSPYYTDIYASWNGATTGVRIGWMDTDGSTFHPVISTQQNNLFNIASLAVQNDTATYKPLVVTSSGYVYKMAGWSGDGNGIYSGSGSLPAAITVTGAGNALTMTGTQSSTGAFNVNNTGNGIAISGSTTGTGSAATFSNSSSGAGVTGTSSSGFGGNFTSTTGTALRAKTTPSSTNTVVTSFRGIRGTSGTAAVGMGNAWDMQLTEDAGNDITTARFSTVFTDATTASPDADFNILTITNGSLTNKVTVKNTGQLQWNLYTTSNFIAIDTTNYKPIVTDATGNIYRMSGWPSSGGISTLNTLTASTQTFAVGTSGSDFNISSSTSTHTFNIPDAGTTARGLVTTASQTFTGTKTFNTGVAVTMPTSSAGPYLYISGNRTTSSSPGVSGVLFQIANQTYTDNSGAGTVSNAQNLSRIGQTTITSSNAITYSDQTNTLQIDGAPIASGSMTLAHPYALYANDVSYLQGGSFGLNEQSSTATLGKATHNIFNGSTATWTLPALSTYPGMIYHIKNAGSGNLTVQRGGSDNIYDTSSVTSIVLAAGTARIFVAGTSFWYVE